MFLDTGRWYGDNWSLLLPAACLRVMVYVHPQGTCSQNLAVCTWWLQTEQHSSVGNTVLILGFPNLSGVAAMLCFICDVSLFGFVMLGQVKSISSFFTTTPFTLAMRPQPRVHLPPRQTHTHTHTHRRSHFSKLATREWSWKDFGEPVVFLPFIWTLQQLQEVFCWPHSPCQGLAYNVH